MNALEKLRLKDNIQVIYKTKNKLVLALRDRKSRKKIMLAFLAVAIPVTIYSILEATRVKADWYDDAYNERQKVSFTHNADVSTDSRVSITVDTASLIADGKMQEDCDDVIFTTIGGDLLKYTVVSGCNTSSTVFDVVLTSVTSGGNNIFMYYSNPTAHSTTDGTVSSVSGLTPSGGTPTLGSIEIGPSPSVYLKMDEAYGLVAHDSTSNLNDAAFGGEMTQDQVIRREINIIDHIATASGDDPSLVLLDTDNYSGTKTYYFEVVAKVSSGTLTVALERSGTATQDTTVTVTETDFTRKRGTAFTPPAGETEYNINLSGGTSPEVKSARIIVIQNVGEEPMTATEAQIELGNYEVGKSNTTAAALNYPKYWKYDDDNWDGTTTFSAEVSWKKILGDASSTTETFTTAGTYSWSCPSTASNIYVEAWGGGGAGGGDTTDNSVAGAGGGGGAYAASTVSLSCPGNFSYTVGAGGSAGTGNGGVGGDSSFDTSGVNVKGGGGGGSEGGSPGAGGSAAASNGTTKYNGGDGADNNASTGGGGGGSAGPSSDGNDATGQTGATAVTDGGPGGNGGSTGTNGSAPATGPGGGGGGAGDKDGSGASRNRSGGPGRPGQIKITYDSIVTTYTVTIKLQEDNGSFGSWTDKQTIVNAVSSVTTPTRTRVSFTPTDGRHYRIVGSVSNAANTYDIYNAKVVATQTGTVITKTESRYLVANTLLSSGTAPQNFDTYFDPDEIGNDASTTYYHEAAGAASSSSSIKLQTDPNSSPSDISNSTLTPSNYAITTAISAPSSAQTVDVVATTNNSDIYSSAILGKIALETLPTLTYPTWVASNDYCVSNGCILFDGVNDMLRIDDHESVNFGEKLNDEFTVQAWIRPLSAGEGSAGAIFQKGTSSYLRLGAGSDSSVADIVASIDLGTTDATITVDDAITLGQWHHIALTYKDDSDDEISIYVDGVLMGTSTNGDGAPATETNTLTIGGTSASNRFDGYIDEFKIYAEERSFTELQTDIIRYSPTLHGTSAAFGNDHTSYTTDGLVAYWKMDDATGATATDSSGFDNDATLNEDVAWDRGVYGGATSYDGTTDYLNAGSSPSLSVSNEVTVSGWVQMDEEFSTGADYNQGIVDKGDYQFYLDKSGGEAKWVVNDATAKVFSAIGGATVGTSDSVYALAVYKGYLYLGGSFATAGGTTVNYIAKYDDVTDTFSAIGGATVGTSGSVYALAVYNGHLYAGGDIFTAGGTTVNGIAKYDDVTDTFSAIGGASPGLFEPGADPPTVRVLAVYNGHLYLGGNFTATAGGTTVNYIAKYDDSTNTFSAIGGATVGISGGSYVAGSSLAVYNGYLYVGGHDMTAAGGTTVNNIAKYDDSTDTFSAIGGATVGATYSVHSLAVYEGYLYLGGEFSAAGGTTVNKIAKYDDSTDTFSAIGGATVGVGNTDPHVRVLAVYDEYLYLGGYHVTTAGGTTVNGIAKYGSSSDTPAAVSTSTSTWTPDTWYHLASTFDGTNLKIYVNGVLESTTTNSTPFTLATNNRDLLIGKTYGSQMAGGSDESFDGLIDDLRIYNTALSDSEIYSLYQHSPPPDLYYKFEENTETSAHDSSGNQLTGTLTNGASWAPGRYGTGATFDGVDDFVTTDSSAYISPEAGVAVSGWVQMGEEFSTGADYNQGIVDKGDYQFFLDKSDGKAKWVVNDATAKAFSALGGGTVGTSYWVHALAVYNGYLYVGGEFTTAGGTTVNNIAKYDDSTDTFSAIGGATVGTSSIVWSLAAYNGHLYVGGSFTTAGGTTVNYIAKYDDETDTFSAIGGATVGTNGQVRTLSVYNGYLYLGGDFTTAGGTTVNRIAKYDDGTDTFSAIGGATVGVSIGFPASAEVYALTVYKGYLYLAGDFSSAGGTATGNIAKYDGSTNTFSAIAGATGTSGYIYALGEYNGYLYLGGSFTSHGNRVARYNDSTDTISAICGGNDGDISDTYAFAAYNGYLYVGFSGTTSEGTTVNNIAKYDDSTDTCLPIGGATVGTNNQVRTLSVYNGYLYVGGAFTTAGGTTVNQIAKYGNTSDVSVASTTSSWTADTWYHLSGTFDGSDLKIYVNGVLENTTTNATPFSLASEDKPLLLGKTYGSQMEGGSGENFEGRLDDFKIYSYAPDVKQVTKDLDAQIPAPDSTLGAPIAHYRFDENGGTTIYDRTGNSRNLTLVASPPSATAFTTSGKFNKAFYDGGTNYAYVDDNAFVFDDESFAINMWFKSDSSSNPSSTEYVLGRGGNSTAGYALYFNSGGNIIFGIDDDSTWSPDDTVSSDDDVYDGQWHSVTAVKIGTSQIDLYIDGVLNDSNTNLTATGSIDGDNTLVIGGRGDDYTGKFVGSIDEVTIFNYEINQGEANVLLNQGKTSQWGALSTESDGVTPSNSYDRMYCVPGDTAACSPPVAEWRMDEMSGQLFYDSGANNLFGMLGDTSSPATNDPTWDTGKNGGGLAFDGTNDYTNVPDNDLLTPVNGITVSMWFKLDQLPSDAGNTYYLFVKSDNTDPYSSYLCYITTTDIIECRWVASSRASSNTTINTLSITTDKWYHFALVRDGTVLYAYLNKELSHAPATGASGVILNSNMPLYFGSNAPAASSYFYGTMDNVKLYDYTRTQAQIAWEYNRIAPKYYYKFNECSGSTAHNSGRSSDDTSVGIDLTIYPQSSGNTTVGTCEGSSGEMWYGGKEGKFNGSLDFDGVDDYLVGSTSPLFHANGISYSNISYGAWFNPDSSPASDTLIHKPGEFKLTTNASGNPQCEIYSSGTYQTPAVATSSLTASSWTHIMCTYDGANIKIYVNGTLEDTQEETDSVTVLSSTALNIGRDSAGSGYFDGQIDEVTIHNAPLTDHLIRVLYNEGGAIRFGD